ncbi:MAG: alpha/beta fold hydrolase, partial [Betaproteobacteria bacterium]
MISCLSNAARANVSIKVACRLRTEYLASLHRSPTMSSVTLTVSRPNLRNFPGLLAMLAIFAIVLSLWRLGAAADGVLVTTTALAGTPVTVYRAATAQPAPVVVIAHGFAGSQQLMQSFALTFARNGYIAVTFDFPGHGRNGRPLTGSLTEIDGATRTLVASVAEVARYARGLGDGRLAVLGHSMATDIVIRYANATPGVAATIAVSMFSPAVTSSAPRNLLVIVGDWEGTLKREGLRAVSLATAPAAAQPFMTYGDPATGTGRRIAFSAHVEHASVLYSVDSLREALGWLDATFGRERARAPAVESRGQWILLLVAGVVLLANPLAAWLPQVAAPALGASLSWRHLWLPLLGPMIATPLLLRPIPTNFLPVAVADYLVVHFALYGALTFLGMAWMRRGSDAPAAQALSLPAFVRAAAASSAFVAIALAWPIDTFVTSFFPGEGRFFLLLAMLVGTLAFFLNDEWLTRGPGAARGAYLASKIAFLVSIAVAVLLDFQRLFFLVLIVPVMLLFFMIGGLFSGWIYRATGHPFVAGIVNAILFAWAIGVTF